MAASHFGLDNLVALVDCNGIQADGPVVLDIEPVADKWRAFGWDATEIDGNDMAAIVGALMLARAANGKPKAIVLRTLPGKGVARSRRARRRISSASTSTNGTASSPNFEQTRGAAQAERAGKNPRDGRRTRPSRRAGRRVEAPFGRALRRSAPTRPEIVGLTADLGKYTDILPFRDAFPERFFNVGMAEQNLVAVAAGLARTGLRSLRHDLRRLRDAPRLRLHGHRLRAFQPQREDHRRPARPDDRLWRHASGDRGSGPDAHDPRPRRHRPVRRHRDRGGDRAPSPTITGRSTCGCCAATCRSCSTPGYRFEIGKAAPPARRRGCRHRLDRLHDRARARRGRDAGDSAASRVAVLHVPTIKPFDAEAVASFAASGRSRRHGREPCRRRRACQPRGRDALRRGRSRNAVAYRPA